MRIGIDARFLGGSSYGLAQYSESLLLALSRHDTQNHYTVYVNSGLTRRLSLGPNFSLVPLRGAPLSAGGLRRLDRALGREPVELLHVHFPLAPIFSRTPTLITVHDVVPFSPRESRRRRIPFWDRVGGRFLYPMTMKRAKWILCVSNATRDRLCRIFPEVFHKTIVMTSGFEDQGARKLDASAVAAIRSRLALPDKYLLYSGSSGEPKNIPRMIEAFALMLKHDPRASGYQFLLDLTGDLSGVRSVESAIDGHGLRGKAVVVTGLAPEDRHVVFREAAGLFMASKEEGFGFPVLKAQMAQVPVIAADSGALPEVCGEGALFVDPDNALAMAEMLGQALFDENLRDYLIERGQKNAARFSWDDTAKHLKQIYELLF